MVAAAAGDLAVVCVLGVDAAIGQEGRGRRRSHTQVLVRVVGAGFVFLLPLPCVHREAGRRAGRDASGGDSGGGNDGHRRKGARARSRRRHGAEGEAQVAAHIAAAVAADGAAGRDARQVGIMHNARRVGH